MKNKIDRKRTHVKFNTNKLQEHLQIHGGEGRCKQVVQLSVDQLLLKLQDGSLTCVEVLRAYQAKVIHFKNVRMYIISTVTKSFSFRP